MLSPLLASRRWEHLTVHLLQVTLPPLNRAAGSLALTRQNLTTFYVVGKWRAIVRRAVHFCQALHSARVVRLFFLERSRGSRLSAQIFIQATEYFRQSTVRDEAAASKKTRNHSGGGRPYPNDGSSVGARASEYAQTRMEANTPERQAMEGRAPLDHAGYANTTTMIFCIRSVICGL